MFTLSTKSPLGVTYSANEMTGYGPMQCRIQHEDFDPIVGEEFHCAYFFTDTSTDGINVHVSIVGDITPSDMERIHNEILMGLDKGVPLHQQVGLSLLDTGDEYEVRIGGTGLQGGEDVYIHCLQVKED